MSVTPVNGVIQAVYEQMFSCYGPQHWWPGDTLFEIIVGAVLTQNSAWSNVEKAIANLKTEACLTLPRLRELSHNELAQLIRPSGYFNIKSKRLKNLCDCLDAQGGEEALHVLPTDELRNILLGVNGVGPETADDILLYGYHRPVFVIDAYTRRIFSRLSLISGNESYEEMRKLFEQTLGPNVPQYSEYHALIVRHAKQACAKRPICEGCCIRDFCKFN